MINYLFPVPIYKTQNESLIDTCAELFNKCPKNKLCEISYGVNTTLKEYSPHKSLMSWNFIDLEEAQPLINYIKLTATQFLKEQQYDAAAYTIQVPNIWLNEQSKNSTLVPHTHYGYTFSGVFYVNCPLGSGNITFHNFTEDWNIQHFKSILEFTPSNSKTWWVPVSEGDMILFPSYLKHSVSLGEFEGVRKSIAFDIVVIPKEIE